MDIDVYQHCPCHSGKKIKFCCGKDVVNELNEIVAKNKAGQALAAIQQLEREIEKHGPLNCLLTIQTHILMTHGEIEKAKASNKVYMESNPDQPIGLQHQAMISLAEGEVQEAVNFLQDAMDSVTGDHIPIAMAQAFRMIGIGLLQSGHLIGARAHLQFAQMLRGEGDEELQRIIFETFRAPDASIFLKHNFRIAQPPQDEEWGPKYANVIRAMDRGQFRKGLEFLKKIDKKFPDQPIVVEAIAILDMFLANIETMGPSWRRYAQLEGISEWDAVEAEAMAQLFSTEAITDTYDIVRTSYELNDFDKASEVAISSLRFSALPPIESDPFGEGPAPRNCFYFLDRDKINDIEQLTLDNVSTVSGEVLMYGKQTDRSARIEWVTARNSSFAGLKSDFEAVFGDLVSGQTETILGSTTAVADALSWNWHLPEGMTKEKHSAMIAERRQTALLEDWAAIKFTILDDKTPKEAASDPSLKIPLSALLLHLEQSADAQISDQSAATSLRDALGIDQLPKIESISDDRPISPVRQQFLAYDKLDDERLLLFHSEAMAVGNLSVLRGVIPELLKRDHLADKVPRDISLSMLAQMTENDEEAFELLQQAKNTAKEGGRPIGVYLVQEMEMRMARGLTDKLQSILQRIQAHHLNEPNVEYQLSRVLNRFGLLNRPPAGAPQEEPGAAPAEAGGIWTPDQEPSPAAEEGESKLWLPD